MYRSRGCLVASALKQTAGPSSCSPRARTRSPLRHRFGDTSASKLCAKASSFLHDTPGFPGFSRGVHAACDHSILFSPAKSLE
ncbi:hypothetical protein BDU57DRAFT_519283 [Ampelomyces quisqualis]|uniref:Uncharacterized protein n=1 Tax=Ampelomyces quisqualis TaxID=50730 RepID=A0A6A5QG16_AMPQU|nr:hypothetical protein BDU57DRAFT_519283 [Ampelomyces quisqualis]